MAAEYSPEQKRKIVTQALNEQRSSGKYPAETCISNEGHDFINTSVFTDEGEKFIGNFACLECRDHVQIELQTDDIDRDPKGWEGTDSDTLIEKDE